MRDMSVEYENVWFKIVRTEMGQRDFYSVLFARASAAAIPIFANGEVGLIREYREPIKDFVWDIPAGIIEEGEEPERSAVRELVEEFGIDEGRVSGLSLLASPLLSPGTTDQRMHIFRASVMGHKLSEPGRVRGVGGEVIADAVRLSPQEALSLARRETVSGHALAAILAVNLESE